MVQNYSKDCGTEIIERQKKKDGKKGWALPTEVDSFDNKITKRIFCFLDLMAGSQCCVNYTKRDDL
jgi:hypothetical protein